MGQTRTNREKTMTEPYGVYINFVYRTEDLTKFYSVARNWYMPTQKECYDYAKYWANKNGAIDMQMLVEGSRQTIEQWIKEYSEKETKQQFSQEETRQET